MDSFIKQRDEEIEELIELEQQPRKFMDKTLYKELIQDVDYTLILDGQRMMDPTDRI